MSDSFEIVIAESGAYLHCRVLAPMTAALGIELARRQMELCQAHGICRMLTDVRASANIDSNVANYDFAYQDLAGVEEFGVTRLAILIAKDDRSHDFVEIVMRNAGYDARLFEDEQLALAWLLDSNYP